MICKRLECGIVFEPIDASHSYQVFCSASCRNLYGNAEYRKRDPERRRRIKHASYLKHKRSTLDTSLRWQARNKDKTRHYAKTTQHRRRAAIKAQRKLMGVITLDEWTAILIAWGYRCAYCSYPLLEATQDHVIPLSKGGEHTIHNVVPACRSCNSSKGDRDVGEFLVSSGL